MIDENTAKYRTKLEVNRKEGTLIYQDLLDADEFFDGKCPYSGTPIDESVWHLEHIIPVKMGGTTDPWNCFPVCGPCNLSKGADHLLDWWDKTHKPTDEDKLEKIFLYIIKALNKERKIRISTQEEINKLKELEKQEELEEESILSEKKDKLVTNIKIAEEYRFNDYINIQYMKKSPSQNYALINYLIDNYINIVENGKLHSIFSYQPGRMKKRFGVDLKQLMEIYSYEERKDKNAIR